MFLRARCGKSRAELFHIGLQLPDRLFQLGFLFPGKLDGFFLAAFLLTEAVIFVPGGIQPFQRRLVFRLRIFVAEQDVPFGFERVQFGSGLFFFRLKRGFGPFGFPDPFREAFQFGFQPGPAGLGSQLFPAGVPPVFDPAADLLR